MPRGSGNASSSARGSGVPQAPLPPRAPTPPVPPPPPQQQGARDAAAAAPQPKNKNSVCEAFGTEESTVTVALLAPRATWRLPAQLSTISSSGGGASFAAAEGAAGEGCGSGLHGALFLVAGYGGVLSVYENYCPSAADGEP